MEKIGPALSFERDKILPALERRRKAGSLRTLRPFHKKGTIDFSSNDYISLARLHSQREVVDRVFKQQSADHLPGLGSTGSRLLTGNLDYAQLLENRLAKYHNRQAALLVNSGYDANLSVLSSLTLNSLVIMDDLCHNSLIMGVRLSRGATVKKFRHNHVADLEKILANRSKIEDKPTLIVVESVYSMDGDRAPLEEIFDVALKHKACVIVDEAHGLGVFGSESFTA